MDPLVIELLKDPRAQLLVLLWLVLEVRRLRGRVVALAAGHQEQDRRLEALEVRTKLRRPAVGTGV